MGVAQVYRDGPWLIFHDFPVLLCDVALLVSGFSAATLN